MYELNIEDGKTGIKGSPTYVSNVYKTDESRKCCFINTEENKDYAYEAVKQIKEILEK